VYEDSQVADWILGQCLLLRRSLPALGCLLPVVTAYWLMVLEFFVGRDSPWNNWFLTCLFSFCIITWLLWLITYPLKASKGCSSAVAKAIRQLRHNLMHAKDEESAKATLLKATRLGYLWQDHLFAKSWDQDAAYLVALGFDLMMKDSEVGSRVLIHVAAMGPGQLCHQSRPDYHDRDPYLRRRLRPQFFLM